MDTLFIVWLQRMSEKYNLTSYDYSELTGKDVIVSYIVALLLVVGGLLATIYLVD